MKLLKNYLNSYKEVKEAEKLTLKEIRSEAKDKALLKIFLIVLPFFLICVNLFVFVSLFKWLMLSINILVILSIYFYQYFYYSYLKIHKQIISLSKAVFYGVIITIIVWILAYFIGGYL